ncbi:MAG: dTDP-glucose 4,6-dehydratase [Candidatus Tectomicrobia bacterium]|nr:dTDP-glucose 4,6-dehydratase [Candidatus Tectomicrobia bacterium]
MRLLVTGGAGFIGGHFIRHMLATYSDFQVINLDKLTYAGNLESLGDVQEHPRYQFVQGDICDAPLVDSLASQVDAIVNFAAETHVDRSILEPRGFVQTNVEGTYVLLEAAKTHRHRRYVQISTDEVYGSIEQGACTEAAPLQPSSPYAASKACGDLLALSYAKTFDVPVLVTRSTNNFGPYQYPEKLIPLCITNALEDKSLPVYGDGLNVRDWLYVVDNCRAIDLVLHTGRAGTVYNIGAGNERTNIAVVRAILHELRRSETLIDYVTDRVAHDRRYAVCCRPVAALGFRPTVRFEAALRDTVQWYADHADWWGRVKSGAFQHYYQQQYHQR